MGDSYINGVGGDTHNNQLHIVWQEMPDTSSDNFYIGGYYSGRLFTGEIREAIVFDVGLSLAEKIIIDKV